MTCEERWYLAIRRDPFAMFGLVVIAGMVFVAIFVPLLTTYDPLATDLSIRLEGPSWSHPMGTDDLGRDLLSRIMYGAKYTLSIAATVVLVSAITGSALGLISGYVGGKLDLALMRVVDVMLAFPSIILALVISGLLGSGFVNLMIALSITQWPAYTRLVRGNTLSLKERDYVEAARALRAPRRYIIRRHILPNTMNSIMVVATMDVAHTIIFASALSFLGLGVLFPTPEWGSILRSGMPYLTTAPHIALFAGLMITLTVLAINLVGSWAQHRYDPLGQETMEVMA
jgi:peptide/nickel transport system permease protein